MTDTESKTFDSVEQALVEELGAKFVGIYTKLGEFPVEDGDESAKGLYFEAKNWLEDKHLLPAEESTLTYNEVVDAVSGARGIDIRVYGQYTTGPRSEFRFMVLPEWHHKRFHLIEASVLVPPHLCDCGGGHEMGA